MKTPPDPTPAPRGSILDQLTEQERQVFEEYLVNRGYPAGQRIIRQGEQGDGCYIIVRGTVRVELAEGRGGADTVLGYIEEGGLVGEMSLVGLPTRSASVHAETDVDLRWLSAAR